MWKSWPWNCWINDQTLRAAGTFSWCLPCSKSPAASPPEEDTDVTSLRMVLISIRVHYTLHGYIFLKCHHSFAPLDWMQSYGCLAAVSLRVNHSLPKMVLKLPCPFCFAVVPWARGFGARVPWLSESICGGSGGCARGEERRLCCMAWRRNKTDWEKGVTVLTQKVSNCYIYITVQSLNCSWSRQIYIPSKPCCILFPSFFLPVAINLDALVDTNILSFKDFLLNFVGTESSLVGFALHWVIKFFLYQSLICCLLNISLLLFYIIGKCQKKAYFRFRDIWHLCLREKACSSLLLRCLAEQKWLWRQQHGQERVHGGNVHIPFCLKTCWCSLLAGQKWEAVAKFGRFYFCSLTNLHKGFNKWTQWCCWMPWCSSRDALSHLVPGRVQSPHSPGPMVLCQAGDSPDKCSLGLPTRL